ncbi:MAG: hypothetical protein QGH47_00955, partial [Candidatus Woesearchaeota archaeon]|nr:hypothetical protein [Candidatus Woesearchaeota archaeon]
MGQKKELTLIVFSVISLFLIAGCGSEEVSDSPFLEGSKGIEISFLQGNPPDEVTDNRNFPFQTIVSLVNQGEIDLKKEQVEISLTGFLPENFRARDGIDDNRDGDVTDDDDFVDEDLTYKNPNDDLTARKKDSEGNMLEPVQVSKTFPKRDKFFNFKKNLRGNTPFLFKAEVCYNYQTKAVSEICVLENMIDIIDDAPCDPSESKSVFSSASPVGVTAFRQNVVGKDKIQFSFDIVHSGSGDVFAFTDFAGTDENCPVLPSTRRSKEDKVKVTIDTGIPKTVSALSCVGGFSDTPDVDVTSQQGIVKLVNGKRTVTCAQAITSPTDFIKSVEIELDFNYLDSA